METEANQRASGEADPERIHRGIQPLISVGPLMLNVLLFVWFWGQWEVLLGLAAIAVGGTLFLLFAVERLATRFGRPVAEWARILLNGAGLSLGGVLTHWSPLLWLAVPFNMLWFHGGD